MRSAVVSLVRTVSRRMLVASSQHQQRLPAVASMMIRNLSDNPSKSPYQHGAHRSDAEQLVAQFPITEVEGTVALCDGGGGAMGHPIEYIQLNTVVEEVSECKYCGLRYKAKHHH